MHSVKELLELGQLMRFPWAGVNSLVEVLNNEQLTARGFFKNTNNNFSGHTWQYPAITGNTSGYTGSNDTVSLPGEHNEMIYVNLLNLTERELAYLKIERII